MRMASIQKSIKMYDDLYDILNVIVGSAAAAASTLEDLWDTVNDELDTSPIENVRDELEKMAMEWNAFEEAVSELDVPQMVVPQIDILSMNQLVNVEVSVMANKSPTPDPQEIRPDTVPNGPPISAGMQIEWNLEESGDLKENESKKDDSKEDTPKEKDPKENTPTGYTPMKVAPKENDSKGNASRGGNSQAANMISSSLNATITAEMDIMEGISWLVDYAVYGANANYDQARAEAQLMAAMLNNPDAAYNLQYTGESPTDVEPQALQSAFDSVVDKAHEIQGQGIYTDNTMIAGATELSSAFSDPTAIVMMMDTLADFAMGVSGGGETDGGTMAQYAGILGDARAGSYEAMTEKGLVFTEAQKAVIEGTATQEQVIAAIGEEYLNASQDIQAAAAINAVISDSWDGLYESLSNTPDGKIIQLNHAFGEIAGVIGGQLYPIVIEFVDLIINNQETIQWVLSIFALGLQIVLSILSALMERAMEFGQNIIDNWEQIGPLVGTIAGMILILAAAFLVYKTAMGVAAVAQALFDAQLFGCPLVWILAIIIAVVVAIYKIVEAVNDATGSTYSALGVIMGALAALGAFLWNLALSILDCFLGVIEFLVNPCIDFANFIANLFTDPIGSVIHLFGDMADTVLALLQKIASGIDFIFGSNLADTVQGWRDGLSDLVNEAAEKYGNGQYEEVVPRLDLSVEEMGLSRIEYGDAWDAGYSLGEGIEERFSDLPSLFEDDQNLFNGEPTGGLTDDENNLSVIAENTGSIKDSLACTEEDLKYLRDIAEQEAVNRYTLAEVKIEQTNHNNINSAMDLDGVVSGLTDAVNESIDSITEGVHE